MLAVLFASGLATATVVHPFTAGETLTAANLNANLTDLDTRIATLEGRRMIVCHYENASYANAAGNNAYTWTTGDCGGAVPTPAYRGVLAAASACGYDEDWVVVNATSSVNPGVKWWVTTPCNILTATAIYLPN